MREFFGTLPSGETASLYTISCGRLSAAVSDYGATLVRLLVPGQDGTLADVVLGYDDCNGYREGDACLGATVGRNANRLKDACFVLNGRTYALTPNENGNNLHSGPEFFSKRMWQVLSHTENALVLELNSPSGDQGFPGNARIRVSYTLEPGALRIAYNAVCDKDTVFNMTNHSYFNLAGHEKTGAAMDQVLILPGRFFNPDDPQNIPTGELRKVEGTPMDFRTPKPIGRDIDLDYEPLVLQGGYDHNWEVFCNPCAIPRLRTDHGSFHGLSRYPVLRRKFPGRNRQGRRLLRQTLRCGAGNPVLPGCPAPSRLAPAHHQGRREIPQSDRVPVF